MYDEFFKIDTADFFDPEKIKVIDGIAGSAKSSGCHRIFEEYGKEYERFTSTNKLKRDSEIRYGIPSETIAGGLFHTDAGLFYAAPKDPEIHNVIIDEILQTDKRVFEWISDHVGEYNIIICTDSNQMLATDAGIGLVRIYEKFCKRPDVILIRMEKTYRARTPETAKAYYHCYETAQKQPSNNNLFRDFAPFLEKLPYTDVQFSPENVYICHTNLIERKFFNDFHLENRYDIPLIPKGTIARKMPKNIGTYPILCQIDADRKGSGGYFQPENIGSVTRYQGSEVEQGHKLYYFYEPNASVSNREFYTLLTRLWDIRDLVLVETHVEKYPDLTEYNGKPVKKKLFFQVPPTVELSEGRHLSEYLTDEQNIFISTEDMNVLRSYLYIRTDGHYIEDVFVCEGHYIFEKEPETPAAIIPEEPPIQPLSIYSYLNKEPYLKCEFIPDFFRTMEKMQMGIFHEVRYDKISGPMIRNAFGNKEIFQYQADLKAAYPHILKYSNLPRSGYFLPRPDGFKEDPYHARMKTAGIDFFLVEDDKTIWSGAICTGPVVRTLQQMGQVKAYYIGSCNSIHGSRIGDALWEMAFKTVEQAARTKTIHYGVIEQQYLEQAEWDAAGNVTAYTIAPDHLYSLLMVAVRSRLVELMLKMKIVFQGTTQAGFVNVDALFFDHLREIDIVQLAQFFHRQIPDYNFRLLENDERGKIVYATFEPLETAAERKARKERERRAARKKRLTSEAE